MLETLLTTIIVFPLLALIFLLSKSQRAHILRYLAAWANTTKAGADSGSYYDHVLPHGPLVQHYANLWTVTGTLPTTSFFPPRTMLLYRLPSTTAVLVHSPICVRDDVADAIDALGQIRYILIPNRAHRLDCEHWARRYPSATVLAPSFARDSVREYVPDGEVAICEQEMAEFEAEAAPGDLPGVYYMPVGYEQFELAYVMRLQGAESPESVVIVVADTFFNLREAPLLVKALGSADGFRLGKYGLITARDPHAVLEWLLDLCYAAWAMDVEAVFMAHGEPVQGRGQVVLELKRAADRLTRDMGLYYT